MPREVTYKTQIELGAKRNSGFKKEIRSAASELDRLDQGATKVGKAMIAAGAAVTTGLAVAAKDAVETYKGFEQEMAVVAGITQATKSEYNQLEQAALDAGSKTVYTAQESASALEYMSLAGWNVQQSTTALMPVLRMATATGKELGTTSDLITDSMGALKLEINDLTPYMDQLIAANNYSNTTAEQLMQALIKTGGAARTVGADLDDTITALGVLANNGTKAEEAGTAMNSMMTRWVSNSTAVKTLNRIGVSIWDAQGKFIGLKETLIDINDAIKDMSDEDQATTIAGIAGVHRYSQMSYLLNSVKENAKTGVSAWDELENHIDNSNGALNKMYDATTNTFENAEKMLESAKEDMQIRITDVFADDARDFIKWLAESLPNATADLVEFAQQYQGEFVEVIEGAEGTIQKAWEMGFNALTWIVDNHDAAGGAIKGIAEGIIAIKLASKGMNIAKTISQLSGLGGGFGGVMVGLTGVTSAAIAAGAAIKGAIENAERKAIDANLEEHFGNIKLSMDEINEIAQEIIGKETLEGVNALNDAISQSEDSLETVNESLQETQKTNWKIKVGYDMTKDDYASYGTEIQNYIKNAEQYAQNRGYEIHLSTSLLFGNESETDLDLTNTFKSAQQQLNKYGNQLYDYLYNETNGALLDGAIDIDENKVVQELQQKMQTIVDDMSAAKTQAEFDAIEMKYSGADMDADSFKQLQKDINKQLKTTSAAAEEAYKNVMEGYEYKRKKDSSYTDEQYAEDSKKAQQAYRDKINDATQKSASYMLQSIEDAYPGLETSIAQLSEKNKEIIKKYTDLTNEETKSLWENNPGVMINNITNELEAAYDEAGLGKTDRKAVSKLLSGMQEQIDALEQEAERYTAAGQEIPEALQNTLESLRTAQGIADGYDGISDGILSSLLTDQDFQNFISRIDDEFTKSYLSVGEYAKNVYSKGYDIDTDVRATLNTKTKVEGLGTVDEAMNKIQSYMQQKAAEAKGIDVNSKLYSDIVNGPQKTKNTSVPIAQNATGGIYSNPLLTTFAENGPEAAIPLDGSARAKSLWLQAGEILGMQGKPGTEKTTSEAFISYNKYDKNVGISGGYPIDERVKATPGAELYRLVVNGGEDESKSTSVPIAQNATGGIYSNPLLTTFAENGPEAAIPLDGSARAKSLWLQAGEILGMRSDTAENIPENMHTGSAVENYSRYEQFFENASASYNQYDQNSGSTNTYYKNTILESYPGKKTRKESPGAVLLRLVEEGKTGGNGSWEPQIAQNATGGIYSTPLLTTFAENGPEAAIPLDGSGRAKSLWMQAGAILGMNGNGQSRDAKIMSGIEKTNTPAQMQRYAADPVVKIVYSPNVVIKGSAKQEDVQKALKINKKDLEKMIDKIMGERKRRQF